MGDSNLSSLFSALKLDENHLTNQFMYVEELNNADGSFIISTAIKDQIERNHNVILILCHNSIGHFHSISQKLGYNLLSLKESGRITVIDISERIINENFLNIEEAFKKLYNELKDQIDKWDKSNGVCIIVENIGNLLLVNVKQVLTFVMYLRIIAIERSNSSFVCSCHNFPDSSNFDLFAKTLRHVADVVVVLKDLQTGRANDVTGYLTITTRKDQYNRQTSEYHYQLLDKSVLVFAPGTRNFL